MVAIEDYDVVEEEDNGDDDPTSCTTDKHDNKCATSPKCGPQAPNSDKDNNNNTIMDPNTPQQEWTPLQQEGLRRICGGCGLGPRTTSTSATCTAKQHGDNTCSRIPIPLKRCSVCHEAWYHDKRCQQEHFPKHKKDCKRWMKKRQQQQQSPRQTAKNTHDGIDAVACCRVQETSTQGRYLAANRELTYGTVVGPHNCCTTNTTTNTTRTNATTNNNNNNNNSADPKDNNHWKPIVAPVLLENHRRHRCAVCFGLVAAVQGGGKGGPSSVQSSKKEPKKKLDDYYPARLCSDACRRTAASFLPSEQQAIAQVYNNNENNRPPMILPTAVLLYRLIHAMERDTTGRVKTILSVLQSERPRRQGRKRPNDDDNNNNDNSGGDDDDDDDDDDPPFNINIDDEREHAHQQAICATAWAMMRASSLPLWQLDDVKALLQQVKLNGFSVCTAESVALGIGIYTTPCTVETTTATPTSSTATTRTNSSNNNNTGKGDRITMMTATATVTAAPNFINHNCQPNLLQSFDYGVMGQFPTLRLTVCSSMGVAIHEELTVSYIDPTMPRRFRQERLLDDYGFHCACSKCQDIDNDDDFRATGYKCPLRNCLGVIQFQQQRRQQKQPKHNNSTGASQGTASCSQCSAVVSKPEAVLQKLLQDLHLDVDPINTDDDDDDYENTIATWEKAYQSAKRTCTPQSWYVRETGERLFQALLDALGTVSARHDDDDDDDDRQQQYALAAQAFQLTEELLLLVVRTRFLPPPAKEGMDGNNNKSQYRDCRVLRDVHLLYKSIKLRLFLNVHPEQAMHELERIVLPTCATFFPRHHEMMRQIVHDCCL